MVTETLVEQDETREAVVGSKAGEVPGVLVEAPSAEESPSAVGGGRWQLEGGRRAVAEGSGEPERANAASAPSHPEKTLDPFDTSVVTDHATGITTVTLEGYVLGSVDDAIEHMAPQNWGNWFPAFAGSTLADPKNPNRPIDLPVTGAWDALLDEKVVMKKSLLGMSFTLSKLANFLWIKSIPGAGETDANGRELMHRWEYGLHASKGMHFGIIAQKRGVSVDDGHIEVWQAPDGVVLVGVKKIRFAPENPVIRAVVSRLGPGMIGAFLAEMAAEVQRRVV